MLVFMDDNTASRNTLFPGLVAVSKDDGIMNRPASSPDLTKIENLWSKIKMMIYSGYKIWKLHYNSFKNIHKNT